MANTGAWKPTMLEMSWITEVSSFSVVVAAKGCRGRVTVTRTPAGCCWKDSDPLAGASGCSGPRAEPCDRSCQPRLFSPLSTVLLIKDSSGARFHVRALSSAPGAPAAGGSASVAKLPSASTAPASAKMDWHE